MDLATVLKNAQHHDLAIRSQAEATLNSAVEAQYGPFLLALCSELATEGKDVSSRQLAGLYIKNLITAQDEAIYEQKVQRWTQCDPATKEQIKAGFLMAIKSAVPVVSHTAAQVLAAYGAVDVPTQTWPGLLQTLFQNINGNEHDVCKVSSLEALGYMCDTLDPESVDSGTVNQILSSIVEGMRADRKDEIRLAAVVALNNSLDFTKHNFENQQERDLIMQAICEATQSKNIRIREKAFECCATVAELYYEKLQPYVEALFRLTVNAIQTDDPLVGMQAIEFWNTICDREISVMEDMEDGLVAQDAYFRITENACKVLVPLVLECMTKQDEDNDDEDAWNISMAAATLLESISHTIGNKIVDLVLPFVTSNINNANWRLKEAAIMAFGMILDGPSEDKLSPLVQSAMPFLIPCLKDPKPLVRDTAAWTIGKICELHKASLSPAILPPLVDGLAAALDDKAPNVVSQACYAVHNLAQACEDEAEANSNVLSHFMPLMLQKLLVITTRPDIDNDNIRSAAYEAINKMVENSALDMHSIVVQLLQEALNRLEHSFSPQLSPQERMNTQSCLCSMVGEIVRKLEMKDLQQYTDRILQLLLQVFGTKGAIAHEDAFLAIGSLAEKMGESFSRYVPYLQVPLVNGLKNIAEYQVCTVAVGVVGDLCRALGKGIQPYCDEIMRCLLELLQSPVLNRSVKPHVISLFSDIAMAIEGEFERYAGVILGILKQAGEVSINTDDEDLIDYINSLRNSILEAYTGIIQGLKAANKQDLVIPFLEGMIDLVKRSAEDEHRSIEVLKSAVGLLGDLGQCYGTKMHTIFMQPFVAGMIREANNQGGESQQTAQWAQQIIQQICNGR